MTSPPGEILLESLSLAREYVSFLGAWIQRVDGISPIDIQNLNIIHQDLADCIYTANKSFDEIQCRKCRHVRPALA